MTAPAIEVRGLRKSYGDATVLDGVDLSIETGSIFALLGPNGAGKTTLINILATLTGADSGTAVVAGVDLAADPEGVREAISLTGQYAAVDQVLTGEENLRMLARLSGFTAAGAGQRASELLERFDLTDAARQDASEATRAACADDSTWPSAWSPIRRWCSSTSRRPGSTPAAGRSSGGRSRELADARHDDPADDAVPRGGRRPRRQDRRARRRQHRRRGHAGRAQGPRRGRGRRAARRRRRPAARDPDRRHCRRPRRPPWP